MKEKHILTDCDGVLLNWNRSFEKFMADQGHPVLQDQVHEYDIHLRHGLTYEMQWKYIREFNESPIIRELFPLSDAVEQVKELYAEGFKFTVITSLSNNPESKKYREENLKYLFGNIFKEIICLPTGSDKRSTLEQWKDSGLFWIEDHANNAVAGYELGLNSILIRHPYNQEFDTDNFHIVGNYRPWKQISSIIKSDYQI
jgi:uncharacterized HAD superfamily protein